MRKLMLGNTKLVLIDDLSPEDSGMLQALYSRSCESVETHLQKVIEAGSGRFLSTQYVGYGHKSIGDCGTTTLYIENVSLLAAKAVQDWPLYCGQETSTRYIDMAAREIVDPVGTPGSQEILRRWMAFYEKGQAPLAEHVRAQHPRQAHEKEREYEGAVKARVFDVMRGFLPAGVTTQLSWHSNLRQAGDHLLGLTKHPAAEVRRLGQGARKVLGEQYAASGLALGLSAVSGEGTRTEDAERAAVSAREREIWELAVAEDYSYFESWEQEGGVRMVSRLRPVDAFGERVLETLWTRPRGCVLPHHLSALGQLDFSFGIDFGSFRDVQRHRNGVCRMPLLTLSHGFEPWYFEQLGGLEAEARQLVAEQTRAIMKLGADPTDRQYLTALGFIVPCRLTYGLPAAAYVMEMRSAKTVHPTLRRRVHEMVRLFTDAYPEVKLHANLDPDDWTVRRGSQTITAR